MKGIELTTEIILTQPFNLALGLKGIHFILFYIDWPHLKWTTIYSKAIFEFLLYWGVLGIRSSTLNINN